MQNDSRSGQPMPPKTLLADAVVSHGEGYRTTYHPLDKPCALCRPPITVTDQMASRAWCAFADVWAEIADPTSQFYKGTKSGYELAVKGMKAALEEALNG